MKWNEWFRTPASEQRKSWRFFVVEFIDYVKIKRHVGLSPAALCAASLWGAAISLDTPGPFPTGYYLRTALVLLVVSLFWNALWAIKSTKVPPMRCFLTGMAEFFGLLVVAAARQPFSFALAGLPAALRSPFRWWVWVVLGLVVAAFIVRHFYDGQLAKRQDEVPGPGET